MGWREAILGILLYERLSNMVIQTEGFWIKMIVTEAFKYTI